MSGTNLCASGVLVSQICLGLKEELKGQVTPKSKPHMFPLTCCAIFVSFEDIGRRDACLYSNMIKLDGTWLVVLKVPHLKRNYTYINSLQLSTTQNENLHLLIDARLAN